MTLDELGLKHGTDKASSFHDYLRRYEPHFAAVRECARVLEIGIAGGSSIRVWQEYFHKANIDGVDHNPDCIANFQSIPEAKERTLLISGEASDPNFWKTHFAPWCWDIVIDDASHHSSQIISTFHCVWPRIRQGGLYCCEDLHSAGYDAAYNRDNNPPHNINAVDYFRNLIHYHVNEHGKDNCGKPTVGDIEWIQFSKSLVIIKKR